MLGDLKALSGTVTSETTRLWLSQPSNQASALIVSDVCDHARGERTQSSLVGESTCKYRWLKEDGQNIGKTNDADVSHIKAFTLTAELFSRNVISTSFRTPALSGFCS